MRAERQAARRAAAQARRRQRNLVVSSVVGVGLVAAGAILLATRIGGGAERSAGSAAENASAGASPTRPGECSYPVSRAPAARKVDLPPATGVETKRLFTAHVQTNLGLFDIALDTPAAPCTTNSFRSLAHFKFFDNTPCHRLTTQGIYVVQCGDPTGKGTGGPGYTFADENLQGATYPKGTVAMANSGAGTNGSQFFLVYQDTQLDPKYAPFGKIVKGLDILARVAAAGSDNSTAPGDGRPKLGLRILAVHVAPS